MPNKDGKENKKTDNSEITEGEGVALIAMTPVTSEDGEFTYKFDRISWQFEAEDEEGVSVPVTRVNLALDNFSRRDGFPVAFGNPYKLGVYEGVCEEVENLNYDSNSIIGDPLALCTMFS